MQTSKHYNGEIELTFDPKEHMYRANGELVHSASYVSNLLPQDWKHFYNSWARNEFLKEAKVRYWKPEIDITWSEIERIAKDCCKAPDDYMNKAAHIGTMTHDYIEKYVNWVIKGKRGKHPRLPNASDHKETIKTDDGIVPRWPRDLWEETLLPIMAFHQWCDKYEPEFHRAEFKAYHKEHKYAGTIDVDCSFERSVLVKALGKELAKDLPDKPYLRYLGDWKTSSKLSPEYVSQILAYKKAVEHEHDIKYDGVFLLRLNKKKDKGCTYEFAKPKLHKEERDFEWFLHLLKGLQFRDDVYNDLKKEKE